MLEKIQRIFALSQQGAKDLLKACGACVLSNGTLMFPVGLLYYLVCDFLQGISAHSSFYIWGILLCLVPVSYTHLDVYKRQIMKCLLLPFRDSFGSGR